jgi:hypothetical protein
MLARRGMTDRRPHASDSSVQVTEFASINQAANNLTFTMKEQGRKEDAIRLMTECVQLCDRILSPGHPHTLSSAAALAEWSDLD